MKVKVKCGFRYDAEAIVDVDEKWHDYFVREKETMPEEIRTELDSLFGAEGVLSDIIIECEEVKE